jgi:hypothetical protein
MQKCLRLTGGLAQAGVYRRGKCSGKKNVCVPPELYRTPRLRQAARTLWRNPLALLAPQWLGRIHRKLCASLSDTAHNLRFCAIEGEG